MASFFFALNLRGYCGVAGAVCAGVRGAAGAFGLAGAGVGDVRCEVAPVVAGSRPATFDVRLGHRKNAPITTIASTASAIIQPAEPLRAVVVAVWVVCPARSRAFGGRFGS